MASYVAEWRETENGSGFVLVRPDGQQLSWERLDFGEDGMWSFEVVGEQLYPGVTASGEFAPGCVVTLQPESDNPNEPNAIAVLGADGNPGGYVPMSIVSVVRQRLPDCATYVLWRRRANDGRADVRLLMARSDVGLEWPGATSPRLDVSEYPGSRLGGLAGGLLLIAAVGILSKTCN